MTGQHDAIVGHIGMATRDHRLAEFNNGPPPPGQPLQLLCEDHNGTYLLPFRCEWRDGAWYAPEKTNRSKRRSSDGGRLGIDWQFSLRDRDEIDQHVLAPQPQSLMKPVGDFFL